MPQLALFAQTVMGLEKIPDAVFKQVFLDYIGTNEDDTAWEGFTQRDLYGFGAILRDFCLAYQAGGLSDGKTTCKICELRVKPRGLTMHVMRTHHMDRRQYEQWRV